MGSIYTDETRKKFLEVLEENLGNITRTCRMMGIKGAHQTVSNWREKHPWFDEAMRDYINGVFDSVESNIFRIALDDSVLGLYDSSAVTARKFLLTHHPEGRRRGYRPRGEIVGEDGGPLQVRSFVELVNRAEEKMLGQGDPIPDKEDE